MRRRKCNIRISRNRGKRAHPWCSRCGSLRGDASTRIRGKLASCLAKLNGELSFLKTAKTSEQNQLNGKTQLPPTRCLTTENTQGHSNPPFAFETKRIVCWPPRQNLPEGFSFFSLSVSCYLFWLSAFQQAVTHFAVECTKQLLPFFGCRRLGQLLPFSGALRRTPKKGNGWLKCRQPQKR